MSDHAPDAAPRLFHVSDVAGVERFDPRRSPSDRGPVEACVWAVDEHHVQFYFLPRDCPRVCFFAEQTSDPRDVERFLGLTTARYVVAIEVGWLDRVRRERLWVYDLPPATFREFDPNAGHWVSTESIIPSGVERVDDLLARTLSFDVELRFVPSLWPLRDAVVTSTLGFSCIRMRNARPR